MAALKTFTLIGRYITDKNNTNITHCWPYHGSTEHYCILGKYKSDKEIRIEPIVGVPIAALNCFVLLVATQQINSNKNSTHCWRYHGSTE
jgi:hypothetical protein